MIDNPTINNTNDQPIIPKTMKVETLTTAEDVLKACTVHGMVVKLPPNKLDRELYLEVKSKLELIGGIWKSGKTQGFVFDHDPSPFLAQIANGEKKNHKKEFQFFATPDALADKLVQMAEIKKANTILEPSAGQGAIIKAIHRVRPEIIVDYCELMDINRSFLSKIPNTDYVTDDFMEMANGKLYDRIIANPPFAKNQDIDHIYKMFDRLAEGGRMVTICGTHYQQSSNKKETHFRLWLQLVEAEVEEVPAGAFKDSGTTVRTVIITINKQE